MKKYNVVFSKVAVREIRHLPAGEIKLVFAKTKELQNNPRPSGCKN